MYSSHCVCEPSKKAYNNVCIGLTGAPLPFEEAWEKAETGVAKETILCDYYQTSTVSSGDCFTLVQSDWFSQVRMGS